MKREAAQRAMLVGAGCVLLAALEVWAQRGLSPETAFVLILAYFVAIAVWGFVTLLRRVTLEPPASSASPPGPPEPSPAGVPVGPRRPAPLVARAKLE